ncbi:MAG: aldolase/citrate lyase family protein, partial [Burkholderiales bacterium]
MIVPAHDPAEVVRYQEFKPDVAVLDLEYSVPPRGKELARSSLKELVKSLGASQAEVFVRIDRDTRWADVGAAVQRGIKGIVFPGAEEPDEVAELGELITTKEKERGVDPGTT